MASIYQSALTDLADKNKVSPFTQDFAEDKGVAGRVNALTQPSSPLMQTARTQAKQATARRGLGTEALASRPVSRLSSTRRRRLPKRTPIAVPQNGEQLNAVILAGILPVPE